MRKILHRRKTQKGGGRGLEENEIAWDGRKEEKNGRKITTLVVR